MATEWRMLIYKVGGGTLGVPHNGGQQVLFLSHLHKKIKKEFLKSSCWFNILLILGSIIVLCGQL